VAFRAAALTKAKTKWQRCSIVGCDCRRKEPTPERDGWHDDEWICRGHWSMAAKHRRTFYNQVRRRVHRIFQETPIMDSRKIVSVYRYLWYRLKREITQKAFGI
jgi:hypothetical protein